MLCCNLTSSCCGCKPAGGFLSGLFGGEQQSTDETAPLLCSDDESPVVMARPGILEGGKKGLLAEDQERFDENTRHRSHTVPGRTIARAARFAPPPTEGSHSLHGSGHVHVAGMSSSGGIESPGSLADPLDECFKETWAHATMSASMWVRVVQQQQVIALKKWRKCTRLRREAMNSGVMDSPEVAEMTTPAGFFSNVLDDHTTVDKMIAPAADHLQTSEVQKTDAEVSEWEARGYGRREGRLDQLGFVATFAWQLREMNDLSVMLLRWQHRSSAMKAVPESIQDLDPSTLLEALDCDQWVQTMQDGMLQGSPAETGENHTDADSSPHKVTHVAHKERQSSPSPPPGLGLLVLGHPVLPVSLSH